MENKEKNTVIRCRIAESVHNDFMTICDNTGLTASKIMRMLIEKWCADWHIRHDEHKENK